jgi:hypothetical protein
MGGPKALPAERRWIFWSEDRKIGLFLQEKARPERVYLLGMKSGFPDCAARIERITATDSVISCRGDKSEQFPNQKWVYDARAKSLVQQFSCQPFAMSRLFSKAASASKPKGAVFVGADLQRLIAVEYNPDEEPGFHVLSNAAAESRTSRVHISVGSEGLPPRSVIYIDRKIAGNFERSGCSGLRILTVPDPAASKRFGIAFTFILAHSNSLRRQKSLGGAPQPWAFVGTYREHKVDIFNELFQFLLTSDPR